MPELSQNTKQLISKYELWQNSLRPKEGLTMIHVDEVASKVAAFYEQIRTIIDWKEEHLMRRAAIIRKLKRRFLDLDSNASGNIAESLVLELVRGGFFPNDKMEEGKIADAQRIIEKYVFILKNDSEDKKNKGGLQLYAMLLEIAACEIEETLAPSIKEMALIDYMFLEMKTHIKVNEMVYRRNLLKEEEKDIQIYIAVQKSLFKLDDPIISYNLLRYKFPFWDNPPSDELVKISENIFNILKGIEHDLTHPLAKKFYTICEKYDTPYLLIGDILAHEDLEKTKLEIADPSSLEKLVKDAYEKRRLDLKTRIQRAAIYSVASIFITKILTLIILGFIFSLLFHEKFTAFYLIADILVPTMLMTLLVVSVKYPSKKNLNLVVIETIKVAYEKKKIDVYEVKIIRQRGFVTRFFLSLIYLIGAIFSFGFIYLVFNYLGFPLTSIVINLIFIALILFAGTAIQKKSRELAIEEQRGGFLEFIADVLFLPLTDTGRWLSTTWKQYNAIAAFFNALVDMPFSSFVEFLERWRYFLKEKKEEIS